MANTQSDVYGLECSTFYVGQGATAAVLVEMKGKENGLVLDNLSTGGTLFILGATLGQTLSAADALAVYTGGTNIFCIRNGSPLNIDGNPRFYLAALGATVQVQLLRGMGQGY